MCKPIKQQHRKLVSLKEKGGRESRIKVRERKEMIKEMETEEMKGKREGKNERRKNEG